eukprot:SAG11_NODE_22840_length_399_cov_0.860000_1_plen_64_part_10
MKNALGEISSEVHSRLDSASTYSAGSESDGLANGPGKVAQSLQERSEQAVFLNVRETSFHRLRY